MMVNDLKNNLTLPWQSTVPQQMPWMRPYEQSSHDSIQFGQQHHHLHLHQQQQQLPHQQEQHILPNKRSSVEMEDDIISVDVDEPPTKQLLSEQKLFKKFGSLQIDANTSSNISDSNSDDDSDSSNDDNQPKTYSSMTDREKEDLNRYVYILFKDKKNDSYSRASGSSHFDHVHCNTALDRLARQERDKLNKAVVLWNPRINIFKLAGLNDDDEDDDDDEEFTYKDHRDFLKNRNDDDDSIIITDVTYDDQSLSTPPPSQEPNLQSSDDQLMLD